MPTHFSYNSLYHNPEPPRRVILDAVRNFFTAIRNSLSAGVVRKRTFSLEFPRYVFNHLFNGKGTNHTGRVYQREDFVAEWFKDNRLNTTINMEKVALCLFQSTCTAM